MEMKNELINLADHLDRKGMHKEADYIDALIKMAKPFERMRQRQQGRQQGKEMGLAQNYIFTVQLHSSEDISGTDLDSAANHLANAIADNTAPGRRVEVSYSAPSLR